MFEPDWTMKPLNPNRNIRAICKYCGHTTTVKPTDADTWQERRRLLIELHELHIRPGCAGIFPPK